MDYIQGKKQIIVDKDGNEYIVQQRKPRERAEHKRFVRTPEKFPFEFTAESDVPILQTVYKLGIGNTWHVAALVGDFSKKTELQMISRRLKLLYHHGYLARFKAQRYDPDIKYAQLVYMIGNKSIPKLKEFGYPIARTRNFDAVSESMTPGTLKHELMGADRRTRLELACRNHDKVKFIGREQLYFEFEEGIRPKYYHSPIRWEVTLPRMSGKTKKVVGVVPDDLFALEFSDAPPGRNRLYVFCEDDRASESIGGLEAIKSSEVSYFRKKIVSYQQTFKGWQKHPVFPFSKFLVLTVTTGPVRARNLTKAVREEGPPQGIFLFTHKKVYDEIPVLPLGGRKQVERQQRRKLGKNMPLEDINLPDPKFDLLTLPLLCGNTKRPEVRLIDL